MMHHPLTDSLFGLNGVPRLSASRSAIREQSSDSTPGRRRWRRRTAPRLSSTQTSVLGKGRGVNASRLWGYCRSDRRSASGEACRRIDQPNDRTEPDRDQGPGCRRQQEVLGDEEGAGQQQSGELELAEVADGPSPSRRSGRGILVDSPGPRRLGKAMVKAMPMVKATTMLCGTRLMRPSPVGPRASDDAGDERVRIRMPSPCWYRPGRPCSWPRRRP
jgi:hypothetical protein